MTPPTEIGIARRLKSAHLEAACPLCYGNLSLHSSSGYLIATCLNQDAPGHCPNGASFDLASIDKNDLESLLQAAESTE